MLNLTDNLKIKQLTAKKTELIMLEDKGKITRKEYTKSIDELDAQIRAIVLEAGTPKKVVVPIAKKVKHDDDWKPSKKFKARGNLEKESHPIFHAIDVKINSLRKFKGVMFKGKKAQQGGAFGRANVHPILILGICLYITPLVLQAMGMGIWGWLQTLGFILIIIGVILSFLQTVG